MSIKDRFSEAIRHLEKSNNFLAVEVTKLGYPAATESIKTAGVIWDDARKKVCFMFNEKFSEHLSDEEFAFVVAHEAMHILNGHVVSIQEKIRSLQDANATNNKLLEFKNKFNKAADCVVNDSLVNMYGLSKVLDPTELADKDKWKGIIYGKNLVKSHCHDLTVEDVMSLLPEDKSSGEGEHEGWESFFSEDGELKKDFVEKIDEFMDQGKNNSKFSDEERAQMDVMEKDIERAAEVSGLNAGRGAGKKSRQVNDMIKSAINWNKIVYRLTEMKKTEDYWASPSRKIIEVYPDILLPSSKESEKKQIFIAIDSSSSINYDALSLFVSIVKNTPKAFEIKAISFDEDCYDYDVTSNERPRGGGGTNFQIIENYIAKNLKTYPKAVVVLTDGAGSVVRPKYPARWAWILYGACVATFCKNMTHYNLKDLLR